METTFNLAETLYVLSLGTKIEKCGFVVKNKTSVFFTSLENHYRFHENLGMGNEDGVVELKGWAITLTIAEQLKGSGATHVGIDPEDGNFRSFPIDAFIKDLKSMMLYGKLGYGSSQN